MLIESDRVKIRKYLGLTSLYLKSFARFENAMKLIQSIADGGSMPDSSTEDMVKAAITKLEAIETQLESLHIQAHVVKAGSDDIELNTGKGMFLLRSEGRRQIAIIANTLGISPRCDYFTGVILDDNYIFP